MDTVQSLCGDTDVFVFTEASKADTIAPDYGGPTVHFDHTQHGPQDTESGQVATLCTGDAARAWDSSDQPGPHTGRIQHTRIAGVEGDASIPDVVIIGCYLEQRGLPDKRWETTVDELELLVQEPRFADCALVIGGDFNCNIGRHQAKRAVSGRWCVHKRPCER
jgi:hypothetical protein